MNAIEVSHLIKKYGDVTAVRDISFTVAKGSFFAFLGENGAGKSTTINMLSTLLMPTSGDVRILGYQLGREDARIRESIGIVFQHSVLDADLTVGENLLTRGAYYGYSKKQTMEHLQEFRQVFDLDAIWKQPYGTLSGGQRRQVDLMRGLINHPQILFLDEPTTGLDPATRKKLWDYIHELRERTGLTVFLTTHYMEETAEADHVVIMQHGRIIAEGSPIELKNRFASQKVIWYAGDTPENRSILAQVRFRYEGNHFNVYLRDRVTQFLWEHRDQITDYEVMKGTMDEVFLAQEESGATVSEGQGQSLDGNAEGAQASA